MASTKVATVLGVHFPAGVYTTTMASGVADIVNDQWGPKVARRMVLMALFVRAFVWFLVVPVLIWFPTVIAPQGYNDLFAQAFRLFLASEFAFFIEMWVVEVWVFVTIKRITGERWFALRYYISTFIAVSVGTSVFVLLGYTGTTDIVPLIVGGVTARLVMLIVFSPFVIVARRGVRWMVNHG
jgi:uncharacterized integral membrane protein (TIGR00697 family)